VYVSDSNSEWKSFQLDAFKQKIANKMELGMNLTSKHIVSYNLN